MAVRIVSDTPAQAFGLDGDTAIQVQDGVVVRSWIRAQGRWFLAQTPHPKVPLNPKAAWKNITGKDYTDNLANIPLEYVDNDPDTDQWNFINPAEETGFTVYDETNWDDLQVSISNVRIPTSNAPTWRLYDHGITSGVTFPALGFALNEYVYFDVQSTHSMKLSTVLDHHIHYTTPTNGTGDKFKFQLDVIAAPVMGQWAVPTGSPFTAETTMSGDYSDDHILFDIAEIPAVNTSVSTLYKCKLTRIAATAKEYSEEVYIEFTDCHYKKDTVGSRTDSIK